MSGIFAGSNIMKMQLQERIDLLVSLGKYILEKNNDFGQVKERAYYQNPWFIPEFIELSVQNIANAFLQKEQLELLVNRYSVPQKLASPKKIGIVMAGNIPLVGFHDLLCTFLSGHTAVVKTSSKDEVLIQHLVAKMGEWNSEVLNSIVFAEQLKGCDAYIATGSNNSSRYFEYYFARYPHIIRKNRTSVAILNGNETPEQLDKLADDIQLYFGLGCRNITKLYVPEGYDFKPLLVALNKYNYLIDFHKYKHNYDYQLSLLIMNNRFYMTNGSVLLTEHASLFSAISVVHYEYYKNVDDVKAALTENADSLQCSLGADGFAFGDAQTPGICDYADGVDTMEFLLKLGGKD